MGGHTRRRGLGGGGGVGRPIDAARDLTMFPKHPNGTSRGKHPYRFSAGARDSSYGSCEQRTGV